MYYNQNNYAHIPYPSSGNPTATVKSGGCGVCCASMIVEALTGKVWPPNQSAAYSIQVGARVSGGTDMVRLGKSIASAYGLLLQYSNNINMLLSHLSAGGVAAVNVGGDRPGYTGLFSDGGHYVTAIGVKDGKAIIYDPGYYSGKFSKAGRSGKVTVSGNEIYVTPSLLDKDAENRNPRYYLFSKEEIDDMATVVSQIAKNTGKTEAQVIEALSVLVKFANVTTEPWEQAAEQKLKSMGVITSDHDPRELVEYGELGVVLSNFKDKFIK